MNTLQVPTKKKPWLISALLYGLPIGILFSVQTGNYAIGIPTGLVAGILFATFMSRFASKQTRKFQMDRPDFDSETLIHEGPANHFKRAESVGGFLWLTTGRLHFRSHNVNIQNHEWTAMLSDISTAQVTKTLGIIANGLLVRLSSGEEHRFVVNQNVFWVSSIMGAKEVTTT
jgi:hypothetical protein